MEELNRLSELVLKELGERNCSGVFFADICDISRNELNAIVNKKKKDIKLSTIKKICENSSITYADIFDAHSEMDNKQKDDFMTGFVITNGKKTYKIKI